MASVIGRRAVQYHGSEDKKILLADVSSMIKKWLLLLMLAGSSIMVFDIQSPSFNNEEKIPTQYTCDGDDISPSLVWGKPPANTQSFVLIVDDPDAPNGTWDHWILFNIPVSVHELPENVKTLPPGTKVGMNSWGRNGYGGPCPPEGVHRYYFKLYALDSMLSLEDGAEKSAIEQAMKNHVLSSSQTMGRYKRLAHKSVR